jgi:hypothetical protein
MKKWIVLFVVVVLTVVIVIPAFAKGNGPFGGGNGGGTSGITNGYGILTGSVTRFARQGSQSTFILVGTITAIGTDTVTIDVYRGNKLVQPYTGTQVTVTVTSLTKYLLRNGTTATVISITDLGVGQPVSVYGTLANNIWTTSRITVGAALLCLPK